MDGNNSLKRIRQVGSHAIADHQVFESDYFLAQENVDKYADEVSERHLPKNLTKTFSRQHNRTVKAIPQMVHNLASLFHVLITGRLLKLVRYSAC